MAQTEKNYWYESRRESKPICGKRAFGRMARYSFLRSEDGKNVRRWHGESMGHMNNSHPHFEMQSLMGIKKP